VNYILIIGGMRSLPDEVTIENTGIVPVIGNPEI
jgi:hypothetical protein